MDEELAKITEILQEPQTINRAQADKIKAAKTIWAYYQVCI